MINVDNLSKPEEIYENGGQSTIKIASIEDFNFEPYDLDDPKDFKYFVDDLKRLVRNSFEYRQLINYLKNTTGMDQCSVLENVTSRDNSNVKIEIHHAPLTLEDICRAIIKKRITNRESLNINECANEVMYIHYIKWLGLIPLSSTVHELTHNNYFFIPVDRIYGNYRYFIESYHDYIDPNVLDAIDSAEEATKKYDNKQMDMFNTHNMYVDMGRNTQEAFINQNMDVRSRIGDIKNNNSVNNQNISNNNNKVEMCYIINK